MTARLVSLSVGLATCALALGYALGGYWTWAPFIVALGPLWLLGLWRDWGWMASLGLVLFIGAAVGGFYLDLTAGWMLLGAVAALVAWDLHSFRQRLRSVGRVGGARELERRHLWRLLVVSGLGLLLAGTALGIKVKFSFAVACLLGLLAALGLNRTIGFLRRESD
jgi:hypothetical protein